MKVSSEVYTKIKQKQQRNITIKYQVSMYNYMKNDTKFKFKHT